MKTFDDHLENIIEKFPYNTFDTTASGNLLALKFMYEMIRYEFEDETKILEKEKDLNESHE